jgi:peptide/nickel transport system substrate-binding protein
VVLPWVLPSAEELPADGSTDRPMPRVAAEPSAPSASSTSSASSAPAETEAPDRRPPARTLRVSLEGEPSHLNPLQELDAPAAQVVMGTVYESLLSCPTGGEYRPALSDGWQVSPDGLRISLHLRPGVRWHDGHPLNVLDVQASLEPLLLAARSGPEVLRASLADVATLELLPDRVVRLTLKRPSDFVLRALCEVVILPDHLLRGPLADPGLLARQPVGTGPFRFVVWERGKRIRLARFSGYWGTGPYLDELVFEVDPDGARALARTRRGEADVLLRVLPIHFPDEVDAVTLHGKLTLWRLRPARWAYVAVNHRRPPLGDASFRRALASLWDRGRFARDLYHDLAHPIDSPPFTPPPDETPPEAVPPDGRSDPSPSPVPASLSPKGGRRAPASVRPGAAAAALEAAGYRDGNADGVRDLDGAAIRLSLLLAAGSRGAASEAHAFALDARRAGILVDTVTLEAPALMARVRKGDFDLALLQWEGATDEDPTPLFGSGGAFNHSGYRSPEVDALLDALRMAPGARARQPIAAQLAEVLARDQPVLFLYQFDRLILVANRVHDLASLGDTVDFTRAWIDP